MHRPRLLWAILPLAFFGLTAGAEAAEPIAGALDLLLLAQSAGIQRGPGMYLNLLKFLPVIPIYILWVYTTHWVHKDTDDLEDPKATLWNSVAFFSGVVGFALLFIIPLYPLGMGALVLVYFGSILTYVTIRNQDMEYEDKVLTPYHTGEVLNRLIQMAGGKAIFNRNRDKDKLVGPPVVFIGKTLGGKEDPTRVEKAEELEDFFGAKELVYDAVVRRATDIHLEPSGEEVAVRYRIDGELNPAEPFDREGGEGVIHVVKLLAALDPTERRKPQEGSFSAKVEGRNVDFRVQTSGTKGGEKMVLRVQDARATVTKLDELGMRPKMIQQVRDMIAQPGGMLIISGPPGSGRTTALYACLRDIDRFLRNVITIEETIESPIDNVSQIEMNPKIGQSYAETLRSTLRQDPDVVAVGELTDAETASMLCQSANTGHFTFSTVTAPDAVSALFKLIDLGVDTQALSTALSGILGVRLVRVLCEACKEPYKPRPDFLQKANLPADKIDVFYRPPQAPEEICPECGGTGYIGRTGFFELLAITDEMRDLIRENPSVNAIKAEARKNGMVYLQEDGLRQVILGKTFVNELLRVMK